MGSSDLSHLRALNPDSIVDQLEEKKKPSKFKNEKVELDGFTFDSVAESQYYLYLKSRLERGEITDLRLQVRFVLVDGFRHEGKKESAVHYIADFVYVENGLTVVVDVKGFATPVYRLKRKLFLNRYCLQGKVRFQEVRLRPD